jgi:uncharacterized protein YlzI (FlbEa/FlbD family)
MQVKMMELDDTIVLANGKDLKQVLKESLDNMMERAAA